MGVGIKTSFITTEIGTSEFFFCFFSTISYHLEPEGWGTRFPNLMNKLYQGKLTENHIEQAIGELKEIREKLAAFSPDKVVWDIDNLDARPPWGNNIAKTITDLSDYFVTSGGKDMFDRLLEVLDFALEEQCGAEVVKMSPYSGGKQGQFYFVDEGA